MPNYAVNVLTISGPNGLVQEFLDRNKGRNRLLTFRAAVPYPKEFEELDRLREEYVRDHPNATLADGPASGYGSGGYEWCIASWGTKWDTDNPRVSLYDPEAGSVTIKFSTAWSPPLPWLEVVTRQSPELTFRLYSDDIDVGWAIEVVCRAGIVAFFREREVEDWAEPDAELPGDVEGPVWGDWRYTYGAAESPKHIGDPAPIEGSEPQDSFEGKLELWAVWSGKAPEGGGASWDVNPALATWGSDGQSLAVSM